MSQSEAHAQPQKPSYNTIELDICDAIGKGEVVLPSYKLNLHDHIKRSNGIFTTHHQLIPTINNERLLLNSLVTGYIHGMDTERTMIDEEPPSYWVSVYKKSLSEGYQALGMAQGDATAEQHFRTIDAVARKFVKDTYPGITSQAI